MAWGQPLSTETALGLSGEVVEGPVFVVTSKGPVLSTSSCPLRPSEQAERYRWYRVCEDHQPKSWKPWPRPLHCPGLQMTHFTSGVSPTNRDSGVAEGPSSLAHQQPGLSLRTWGGEERGRVCLCWRWKEFREVLLLVPQERWQQAF